ncbi:hypothetical protein WISP_121869 [Willisornis vidua]|uniref:Uncharacterized protein n=1 Tax=Willisornis vidua TaxID=1566151 RepID=A0ABQ9CSD8_9PASS|nr:hypothetical protein WISP_121869 [Willisornis vidua]
MGDSVFSERPALRYGWPCQQETAQEQTEPMYTRINHNVFLYSVPEQPGDDEKIMLDAGGLKGLLVDGIEHLSLSCFTFFGFPLDCECMLSEVHKSKECAWTVYAVVEMMNDLGESFCNSGCFYLL